MSDDVIDQMRADMRKEFGIDDEPKRPTLCAVSSFFLVFAAVALLVSILATMISLAIFPHEITHQIGRYTYTILFCVGVIILISSGVIGEARELKRRFRMGNSK